MRHSDTLHFVEYARTHCNTLQHTATHCHTHSFNHERRWTCTAYSCCNTLQHTATHCNTHCNTLRHTFIQSHTQVDMHRIFQRDLCKLRLNAARAYVKGRTVFCSVFECVVVCCSELCCVALCLNVARAYVKGKNCRSLV